MRANFIAVPDLTETSSPSVEFHTIINPDTGLQEEEPTKSWHHFVPYEASPGSDFFSSSSDEVSKADTEFEGGEFGGAGASDDYSSGSDSSSDCGSFDSGSSCD